MLCQPIIVHWDIKASNTLLKENLGVKIDDFSVALLFRNKEVT